MKKSLIVSKKHIILSVLVVALAAAVYLNWQFGQPSVENTEDKTSSYLGAAQYVNGSISQSDTSSNPYFSQTRETRESSRKEKLALLNGIVSNAKSTEEEIKAAKEEIGFITNSIESEANIESLVKAKGFTDCAVVINKDMVTVVVPSEGLLASQTMQIQEIVSSQTGFSIENIKIIEIN